MIPAIPLNGFQNAYLALATLKAKANPNAFLLIEKEKEIAGPWAILDTAVKKLCTSEGLDPSVVWVTEYAKGVEWLKQELDPNFDQLKTSTKKVASEVSKLDI